MSISYKKLRKLPIDKVKSTTDRVVHAQLTIKNGWSRDVLVHQIEMGGAASFGKGLSLLGKTEN